MNSPNCTVAPGLAKAGFFVFPCYPKDEGERDEKGEPQFKAKRPLYGVQWRRHSTTDPEQIAAWWRARPDAVPAIDCARSGLLVIDADRHDPARDGVAAWQALAKQHKPTYAPVVETPNSGLHIYFRNRTPAHGNKEGRLKGTGMNVRGFGGFVIAAGAIMADARKYLARGDITAIKDMPDWLWDLITDAAEEKKTAQNVTCPPEHVQKTPILQHVAPQSERETIRLAAYVQSAVDAELDALRNAPKGGRNNALNTAAFSLGTMAGAGWLSAAQAEALLCAVAEDIGLGRAEAAATVASGLHSGMTKPRDPLPDDGARPNDDAKAARGWEIASGLIATRSQQMASSPSSSALSQRESRLLAPQSEIVIDGAPDDDAPYDWLAEAERIAVFDGAFEIMSPPAIIRNLLPRNGLVIDGGQSGAGKSYIEIDMAVAIASGQDWFGEPVRERCGVVYIAAEGWDTIGRRIISAKRARGIPDSERLPLALPRWPSVALTIDGRKDVAGFNVVGHGCRAIHEHFQARFGVRLGVGIFDTVSSACPMRDENNNAEVAKVVGVLGELRRALDICLVGVHHFGKNQENGMRGGSAWRANCDHSRVFLTDRDGVSDEFSNRRMMLEKNRLGKEGQTYGYELSELSFGRDTWGDDITECFIEPVDYRDKKKEPRKEPESVRRFRAAYAAALTAYEPVEGVERPNFEAVPLANARNHFNAIWATGEEMLSRQEQAKRNNAWHRAGERVRGDLFTFEIIGGTEWLWPI